MTAATKTKLNLVVLATAGLASVAHAADVNSLRDLKVASTPTGAQVVISGSRAPVYTVFRLGDPDRLVIDVSSADATGIKGHHEGAGPVNGVVASQFSDDRSQVGRVMVGLTGASQYDVRADGSRVIVTVDGAKAAQAPTAGAAPTPAPVQAAPTEPTARAAEPASPPSSDVVASRVDEVAVKKPAKKLTMLAFAKDRLDVHTDGEVAKFEIIELGNPPRLAIDLYGLSGSARQAPRKITSRVLREIRLGSHADRVRLVFDLKGDMPTYRTKRTANGLSVFLEPAGALREAVAAVEAEPVTDAEPMVEIDGKPVATAPAEPASKARASGRTVEIRDLSFEEDSAGGRIDLKLAGDAVWRVERPDERSAALTLEGAKLPKRLERSLDTSALETPVKMVSAFTVPGGGDKVRVVVASSGALTESVMKTAQGLTWKLAIKGVQTEEAAVSAKTAGFTSEATRFAEVGAAQRSRYVGKKVSFEFKDIDIHNLLRIIAEISKKNIVVADDVQGKITIRLRNVPWDQALELILRSKGLGKEDLGNIIRVAPLKTLEEETKLREERRKSQLRQEELIVQLLPVNYATADVMSQRIKETLSERGSVTVDTRTNVLIVRDVAANVAKARSLVQRLDTQTPQVLIESRIVEANTTFTKQLGVQWGGQTGMTPNYGNPTGLVFPNSVVATGAAGNEGSQGVSNTPNYAVNLPAPIGIGQGGGVGFFFGSAGGALQLNLRLSALENQGVVKTISAPKVTTIDNSTARISQGVSVPFSQVSASGVNTSFIEARLSLEVTPHITSDGSVLMNIRAENNQPDPSATGANGQPSIQRKEANTQVLVKDGDTTVIGGIYVRRGANSTAAVPLLGKIPILGFFFKTDREIETRQELLIFITPRIINRQATMAGQNL